MEEFMMKDLFKRRKYKITFTKSYQFVDIGVWKEVTDSHILQVLYELQTEFDFEIISTKLRDCFHKSKIVIRCNRGDKNKIYMDFVRRMSGKITKIVI